MSNRKKKIKDRKRIIFMGILCFCYILSGVLNISGYISWGFIFNIITGCFCFFYAGITFTIALYFLFKINI